MERQMIIATYVVKDDHDILEQGIVHHLENGVDAFIVTEHNSCSASKSILDKYDQYIIERIKIYEHANMQNDWVEKMMTIANKSKPDWIFHSDCDELWYGLDSLYKSNAVDVLRTKWVRNYLPYSYDQFNVDDAVYYEQTGLGRSWFDNCYEMRKVVHRPITGLKITLGNHIVVKSDGEKLLYKDAPMCNVWIKHYPVRTYNQFVRKVSDGAASYLARRHIPNNAGWHWLMWYKQLQEGTLKDTFAKYMSSEDNIGNVDYILSDRIFN